MGRLAYYYSEYDYEKTKGNLIRDIISLKSDDVTDFELSELEDSLDAVSVTSLTTLIKMLSAIKTTKRRSFI